jgi:hypothetical protein
MAPLSLLLTALLLVLPLRAEPTGGTEPGVAPADAWLDSVVLLVTGPALCAGVVIDGEGTVATAYHCVANGRRPQVRTRGGGRHLGRVVATAPRDDLALLEVPGLAGVSALEPRATPARIGETVWALGHPYATQAETSPLLQGTLAWSVSRGVVSAVGQRLIQVDAALNPGNSGGPVVDAGGRIVGIASRRLSADNIAFISPTTALLALMEQPERTLLGGTWGLSLVALQGLELEASPSAGVALDLGLRDRLLAKASLYLPLGQRWTAVSMGRSSWVSGELSTSLRLRVGRGRLSTTFDLGAVALVSEGLDAELTEEAVHLWSVSPALSPGAVASVGMAGSSLRVLLVNDAGAWTASLGLELGFPGVLGVF